MKILPFLFAFSILVFGCGSKPIPDWKDASFNQLESYKKNYLIGKTKIAELHFSKAIEEIKKSGDLKIMTMAYLTKFAVNVAVLENFDDRDYLNLEAVQDDPENKNFYNFLKGLFEQVDESLLPREYRGFLKTLRHGGEKDMEQEIAKIEEPLSKLIVAGLLVRKHRCPEVILKAAADTASENGWKKALVAYLTELQSFYETKKEMEKAANIQRRLQLINN
ncbi:MAG: hypothetical protein Q7J12_06785 [Syntrophales bacterium]|nr:hypothetical protein [Syntrophales bacterium]